MKFTFAPESRPLEGYTIKRAIHRGGFGEVYFAISDAGREVAVKLLNNNLEVELRGVRQCLNLNHPNLVTIFDIRQDADRDYWIVMEYVGGTSLLDVLHRHPSGMPLPEILRWLSGMAQGLAFLHDRGLVHRDLKPANVLSDGEQVKIGDVGLSKYISESRRSAQTQSVGTVYYMAPEVCRGRYGREVDVYALGVMLVEMLTGQMPFDGETTAEILMKHLTADPDLSMLAPAVQDVLRGALEKDPDKRIQDVLELQRRFCAAVEAPGSASPLDTGRAAAAAFAETLPGPADSRQAAGQPVPPAEPGRPFVYDFKYDWDFNQPLPTAAAAASPHSFWKSLQQFWRRLPEPVRWVLMGAVLLSVVSSEVFVGSEEAVAGGLLGFAAWYLFVDQKAKKKKRSESAAGSAVQPSSGTQPTPATTVAPLQPEPPRQPLPGPGRAADLPQPSRARQVHPPLASPQLSLRDRLRDMNLSAAAALPAVLVVTASLFFLTDVIPEASQAVFFGLTTLICVWVLLIPAKLWEGVGGEGLLRRSLQFAAGILVGLLVWCLQDFLLLGQADIFRTDGSGVIAARLQSSVPLLENEVPTPAGFMAFFGLLFGVRKWWSQADRWRSSRLRISSAMVSLLAGAAVSWLLPFPVALGSTLALSVSMVLQLSAGWLPLGLRGLGTRGNPAGVL